VVGTGLIGVLAGIVAGRAAPDNGGAGSAGGDQADAVYSGVIGRRNREERE
jgi:hypothetical protein